MECRNFQVEEPKFAELYEVSEDINKIKSVWGVYEEFQNGLQELTKEDWVSFRTKTFRFDEFLQNWQERIRKEIAKGKPSSMQLKIQQDIDAFKVKLFQDFD